ncbi:hypothetical protein [Streptomyces griseus]|uniref:hypothetical protein n=1 Tax=Streptomyces griseus TaxID=1911 RepID=UPI00131B2AA2|nr:hypothetical protein [Streptomyces griseus]
MTTTNTTAPAAGQELDPRHDVDLAQLMFRRADVERHRAAMYAAQAEQERAAGHSDLERRTRERDAAIATVVLIQACVEAFINWAHIRAGNTVTSMRFMDRANALPTSASRLRPSAEVFAWTDDEETFFGELTKWRNFLGHASPTSRNWLRELLVERGEIPDNETTDSQIMELLTADLAARFVDTARTLMTRAATATGTSAPFTLGAWHAPDELEEPALEDPAFLRSLLRAVLRRTGTLLLSTDELSRELDQQHSGQTGLRLRQRPGQRRRSGRWMIKRE